MNLTSALRLIITRSPNASQQAMTCLRAAQNNSPVVNRRYAYVLEIALNDPEANFTQAERADLASLLEIDAKERKSEMIALRVTTAELEHIQQQAETANQSISDWIREKIL
jgi:hypothetical protein